MKYTITDIEFDFTDDIGDGDTMDDFLTDDVMSITWDASDHDDLIEEITSATGWCVKSIDYSKEDV